MRNDEMTMILSMPWRLEFRPGMGRVIASILVAVSVFAAASAMPEEAAVSLETGDSCVQENADTEVLYSGWADDDAGKDLTGTEKGMPAVAGQEEAALLSAEDFAVFSGETAVYAKYSDDTALPVNTVPAKDTQILSGENPPDVITGSLDMPALSFTGALQDTYCVGSEPDLDGITVISGGKEIPVSSCLVEGWDTSVPGEKILTVSVDGSKLEIPYTVLDYKVHLNGNGGQTGTEEASLWNYRLGEVEEPVRLGRKFTGWYRDPECTIPFETASPGESYLELYAGWKEFDGFICDEYGYITGCNGAVINDGLLVLPSDRGCIGIRSGAFSGISGISEIYIPAGITCIEEGAFEGMPDLFYVEVSPENPCYFLQEGAIIGCTEKGTDEG